MLRRLIGEDLESLTSQPIRIVGVAPPNVLVASADIAEGQLVPIAEVEAALVVLRSEGFIDLVSTKAGDHSAFIGAVLCTLPGTDVSLDPPRVRLVGPGQLQVTERTITHEGASDRPATRQERREQGKLRSVLVGPAEEAACALCGDVYPVRFLWASHIKARKACTEDERRNLGNVAMLACLFGCDVLFEHGYVGVTHDGVIHVSGHAASTPSLAARTLRLTGRPCLAHRASTANYFEWHRLNKYLGD